MSKEYEKIFAIRGASYNRAAQLCPAARSAERENLLKRLNLQADTILCDIPAGGGYVADGIAQKQAEQISIVCVEPSLAFAQGIDTRHRRLVGNFQSIPIADKTVDRVSSLAGIHHLTDKQAFYDETVRILKPGGRIAIADAQVDTPTARFLNDAVDRLTETGHEGLFLEPNELTQGLENAGYTDVEEELLTFTWDFPNEQVMTEFCQTLFCLTRATHEQVKEELSRGLRIAHTDVGVQLEWSLIYATGSI